MQKEPVAAKKPKIKKGNELFERLRALRAEIAKEEEIPAYLVFSDKTLKELEQARPVTEMEFLEISGVGQRKLEVYGDAFIKAIIDFQKNKIKKKGSKSATHQVTYELLKDGLSVEAIATKRDLKDTTVYSHLAKLAQDGADLDLYNYVSQTEVAQIKTARQELEHPEGLKPYFEHFEEKIPYYKIRLALTLIEMEG